MNNDDWNLKDTPSPELRRRMLALDIYNPERVAIVKEFERRRKQDAIKTGLKALFKVMIVLAIGLTVAYGGYRLMLKIIGDVAHVIKNA